MIRKPMNRARILAFAGLASLAAIALAQSGGFDAYASNIMILMDRKVQDEIGVNESQREKLNVHADWFNKGREKLAKDFTESQKKDKEAKPPVEAASKMEEEFKTKVVKDLSQGQLKRLREITLQATGPVVLLDERVSKEIGMTQAQLNKLRKAHEAGQALGAMIERRALGPIVQKYQKQEPKTEEARKKAAEAMNKEIGRARLSASVLLNLVGGSYAAIMQTTLTEGQKKDFRELLGKPFQPA
jgi:NAD/NADP transhydrogenase alpha subunit